MPTPQEGESRDEFMERCIPIVLDDGTAEDPDQAVAVCSSMWEREQEGKMIRKTLNIHKGDDDWVIASTPALDRDKDRVYPLGFELGNWQDAGAPLLWGHNYQDPFALIGSAKDARLSPGAFEVLPEWREPASTSDPMHIIRALWDAGLARSFSVGFIPKEWEENEAGGTDFLKSELLEVSLVTIGANQEALRLTVKALSNDPDDEPDDTHPLANQFIKAIEKRGRVLSAANENKLRKASDLLREVLAQVEEVVDDEKRPQKPPGQKSAENNEVSDLQADTTHPQGDNEPNTAETADESHTDNTQPDDDADVLAMMHAWLDVLEQTMR